MNIRELFRTSFYERYGQGLLCASLAGFWVSLLANLSAVLEFNWHQNQPVFLFSLMCGTFLLWLPCVLTEIFLNQPVSKKQESSKVFLAWLPRRVEYALTILIVYTIFNFLMLYFFSRSGVAHFENGGYFLREHGNITALNKQQYHAHKSYEMKFISSYCMFFYLGMFYFCTYRSVNKKSQPVFDQDSAA